MQLKISYIPNLKISYQVSKNRVRYKIKNKFVLNLFSDSKNISI